MSKVKFKPSEKTLKNTLEQQSYSYDYGKMMDFIIKELKSIEGVVWTKDAHDNFYAEKGSPNAQEYYPCVVAHYDTVHKVLDDKSIHKSNGHFYGFDHTTLTQCGTGGDDLVGVWTVFELLKHRNVIKIALFAQEEIGCVGSGKANMDFFKNVGYILQTDRKGNGDFVNKISNIELSSDSWIEHIKPVLSKHKYEVTDGGLTDVKTLVTKGVGVCTANMSSGYYRPHTSTEVVSVKDAKNVCSMMNNIIEKCGLTRWEHKYEAPKYDDYGGTWPYSSYGTVTRYGNSSSYYGSRGNSWYKNKPKSSSTTVTKTRRMQNKLGYFLKKGWWKLNINEMKSFVDTLKFVQTALNKHAYDILLDLIDEINLSNKHSDGYNLIVQLDLLCERTIMGDEETDNCSLDFYACQQKGKEFVVNCEGCSDGIDLLEHFKNGIDMCKSEQAKYTNQLTIEDIVNDNDKIQD